MPGWTAWLLEGRVQGSKVIRSRAPDTPLMDGHNLVSVLPPDLKVVEAPLVIGVDLLLLLREIAVRAGVGARLRHRLFGFTTGQESLLASTR